MVQENVTRIFEALSSSVRLDIFRLLVKKGSQGLVAGQIADALSLPGTNLSFHLKALVHTGLLSMEQEGRFLRYRANIPLMLDIISYLMEECCLDNPEECLNMGKKPEFLKEFLAKKR